MPRMTQALRANLSKDIPKKSSDHNYRTAAKDGARDLLIEETKRAGITPARILTLPSRYGMCTKRFKKEWPKSKVYGVERMSSIVMSADTVGLEALYLTDFDSMIAGRSPQIKAERVAFGSEQKIPYLKVVSVDYGTFDMAFLDGCGTASIAFKKSVRGVVEKFIVLGGIVGITVSLQKGETAQAVAQAIIRDSGLHHILTYPYKTNSKMLMVIGKK